MLAAMSLEELKQAEMNKELRAARTWLIVVGFIMFVFDMILIYAIPVPNGLADAPPQYDSLKTKLLFIDLGVLAAFIALWFFSKRKPKLCLILGLCLFWAIHIFNAIEDPSNIYKGIVIKVLFTLALIKGIKSAGRAEDLRAELGKVFE